MIVIDFYDMEGGHNMTKTEPMEYAEVTHDCLRSAPNGDTIATFDGDYWTYEGVKYTDFVVSAA